MKIFVKTPKGSNLEIEVKPQNTVAEVRKIVEAVHGDVYPASLHSLTHQGKVLKNSTTLEENKVAVNSLIVIKGLPNMGDNVGGSNLEFLRNNPQFQAMRAKVQGNPQLLEPMVQELGKQNPQLTRLIQENQAEFLRLVNEPAKVTSVNQQPPQQKPVVSLEEEALKRNTDCVYFLASPLTCKKGSECEYRHSEYARVNPRDCWYWLNSTCLNPKCAFRHPPVEGLLGAPATPSAIPAPSSSQAAVAPEAPSSQNPSKVGVACIYFQKGYCMKGDRCSFAHGQNPTTSVKVTPQTLAPTTHGSQSLLNAKKPFVGGLQKCTAAAAAAQEQKLLPQVNMAKPVGAPPVSTRVPKIDTALPRNVPASKVFNDEHVRAKAASSVMMNGISTNRLNRSHQVNALVGDHGFQNGKDGDEFLRESSPGFDVLVEDEVGDQDYFHGEDQYGRSREYDIDQTDDYGSVADGDRDRLRDLHSYESFDRVKGKYGREQHQGSLSSERMAVGATQFERRGGGGYRESNSPDNVNTSDLRHRLSKQRRVNGLQSVISHGDHNDDRNYRNSSRRDSNPLQPNKAPVSSRLRGRINFGTSAKWGDAQELDQARRGGFLPNRPQPAASYQGRFRDRLKDRVQDDEGRNVRGSGESSDFTGPKSLSELKSGKGSESILGKRKNPRVEASQQTEGNDPSFEGPKSLSEILKRKREARGATSTKTPPKSSTANVVGTEDKKVEDLDGFSSKAPAPVPNANELEVEDGIIYDDDVIDDQEHEEADDQAQEEYEYEQVEEEEEEEGEYDVENVEEGEDEYLDDEDDDFAKKIGVLSSSSS